MTKQSAISPWQVIILLFLSRIFSLLTFVSNPGRAGNGSISAAGALLSLIPQALVILPAFFLLRRYAGMSLLDCGMKVWGKWGGKLLAVLVWIAAIVIGASTVSEFEMFLTTAAYPDAPRTLFSILFIAAVAYGVWVGLESFARFSLFVFVLFAASLVFIGAALAKDLNFLALVSPLYDGPEALAAASYSFLTKNFESVIFLLLIPFLKKGRKTAYAGWNLLYSAVSALMVFLSAASLGDFGRTQLYPFYTMASVAELSIFERMDSIHMAIWSFVGFIKGCMLLFAANECIRFAGGIRLSKYRNPINAALIILLSFFFTSDLTVLKSIQAILETGIPVLILLTAIPLLLLITDLIRKRGNHT